MSLRFPDEHASNISRSVNLEDCRLYRMKRHDYHVFMQTVIPLVYWDLLLNGIWDAFKRSIISLEIYAPTSCKHNILRGLK